MHLDSSQRHSGSQPESLQHLRRLGRQSCSWLVCQGTLLTAIPLKLPVESGHTLFNPPWFPGEVSSVVKAKQGTDEHEQGSCQSVVDVAAEDHQHGTIGGFLYASSGHLRMWVM